VDDVFRRVGMEEVTRGIVEGASRIDVSKAIKERLLEQGRPFFTDRAGHKWDLDRYTEMVARTTTREAATQGTINRLREHEIWLTQVSAHNAADFCLYYENVIVFIGDEPNPTPYPPISAIEGGTPFHPNCAHVMTPFVERLATEPEKAAGKIDADLLNKSPAELQRRFRAEFPERAKAEGKRLREQAARRREGIVRRAERRAAAAPAHMVAAPSAAEAQRAIEETFGKRVSELVDRFGNPAGFSEGKVKGGQTVEDALWGWQRAQMDYFEAMHVPVGQARQLQGLIEAWTGGGPERLETVIRAVEKGTARRAVEAMRSWTETVHRTLGIPDQVTLYRGIYGQQARAAAAAFKRGESLEITVRGLSSWTDRSTVARIYAGRAGKETMVVRATLPRGQCLISHLSAPYVMAGGQYEWVMMTPGRVMVGPARRAAQTAMRITERAPLVGARPAARDSAAAYTQESMKAKVGAVRMTAAAGIRREGWDGITEIARGIPSGHMKGIKGIDLLAEVGPRASVGKVSGNVLGSFQYQRITMYDLGTTGAAKRADEYFAHEVGHNLAMRAELKGLFVGGDQVGRAWRDLYVVWEKQDGVSPYAKAWWKKGNGKVSETIAEMYRLRMTAPSAYRRLPAALRKPFEVIYNGLA
jgi:hypothetical protein